MLRRMRNALVLCLLAFLPACGSGNDTDLWASSVISQAKDRGTLRIATEPKFPPFGSIENGELVGFDIDLGEEIGRELGVDVEWVQMDFDGVIAALTTGRVDLIMSGMTATPQRSLRVSYSAPYFHTITCLLVSKQRAGEVRSVEDLNEPGRRVMVKLGTTGQKAAEANCPKAEIVPLRDEAELAAEVAAGRADAFLFDKRQIEQHHARYPDETFIVRKAVSVEPYSIAAPIGDPETLRWLDLVLYHMRLDGRLEELYAKHGLEDATR